MHLHFPDFYNNRNEIYMINPFKFELPTLYARSKTGAVLTWDIEVEDNMYRTITGQLDGTKAVSYTHLTLPTIYSV